MQETQVQSPGVGNGFPLHYSCLGNPMDRGNWWATVRGVAKSQKSLSNEHLNSEIVWYNSNHHLKYFMFLSIAQGTCMLSYSVIFNSLQSHELLCPQDSPGNNTGVGCYFFLQGIFPTQGLNSRLLHVSCVVRQILYH